jgi:hypothetical protein
MSVFVSVLIWIADQFRAIFIGRRTRRQHERQLVFALLTWLGGRAVLFNPWTLEEPELVAGSVLKVRARVDDDLASLRPGAKAIDSLLTIRAACLQYLTRVPHPEDWESHWPDAINDLRAGVASGIESLERDYGITMPGGLGREQFRVIYLPMPGETTPPYNRS